MSRGDPLLYSPEEAAELLGVKASWLRRKAADRAVPCTFVGKHLRFSRADLEAIVAVGARPVRWRQRRWPALSPPRHH
ncbi:helix-turn-helix domain-containing protein [Actinomadura litoris]|nr:helix-turn-helix domain-containing protein [Actinomadura litoris]